MLHESFKDILEAHRQATHAPAGKFEKIWSKNSSYEQVFRSFSGNFPEASRKVPGPSQNDPGSIWETSFFDEKFA